MLRMGFIVRAIAVIAMGTGLSPACSPSTIASPTATEGADVATLPEEASSGPDSTATPTESTSGPTSGACTNAYYPIVDGAEWQYAGTSSLASGFSFTRTYADIRSDGFTDQDEWDSGLIRTGEWGCDKGNIQGLTLGAGAGSVSTGNMNFVADSTKSEGVTIPATMSEGDTWTQTLSVQGMMTMADGNVADASGDASRNCMAQGSESVTVPAGTFDAMRVECQVEMTITVTMSGLNVPPIALDSTSTVWYAPNIGVVRSTDVGSMGSETHELQSYSIP
jgi:hypothetical protein